MAFVEDAIISGFTGEAISRCTDISLAKIKEAIKNRKYKHQNIESQIYNVIVNVLNQLTYNKFENDQEKIYQAAEMLLIGYKDSRCDSIEVVRLGLQILGENITDDRYIEFKKLLYRELSKEDYEELYRQIRLLQQDEESDKTTRIENSVNEIKRDVREIKQVVLNEKKANEKNPSTVQNLKFQNNKKQDYIKNWNSKLFLHMNNDENPITLADAFIMPDYKMHKYIQGMDFFCFDTLDDILKGFIEYNKTSTMLITGVPGIGKSSITSWMANEYKENDRFIILRFRDWDSEELEKGLSRAICNQLECKNKDLNDKILILDGFDEMKSLNIRDRLLNAFFNEIKDRNNFKCIITSRPAYIDSSHFQYVIELKEFNIDKIALFYRKIKGINLTKRENIESNLEVLGIPVILYMAIMSGVDINENYTKSELYNKIFAEEGGIFDKFFDGENEYSAGSQIMRNPENIKRYLEFLCEIAYMMFANNKPNLKIEACKVPELVFQKDTVSILEFPIKHLFENIKTNIEFIHKTIYEYFTSEYIYIQIIRIIEECENKDCVAGKIAYLLQRNHLSEEICEFLKYKISQNANMYYDIYAVFELMICDGMTYHMINHCKDVIKCEMNVFANMLEILHMWNTENLKFDDKFFDYVKYRYEYELNLSGINFAGKNLTELLLANVDLSNANLDSANLEGMDLRNTKFIGARINNINLDGAILDGAIFSESHISYLRNKYNLRGTKVYCSVNNTILNQK